MCQACATNTQSFDVFCYTMIMNFELNLSFEKPVYSGSHIDGVSLIDVSQINISSDPEGSRFRMAFYEPPYNKIGISSFVLERDNHYYLFGVGQPDYICECTYWFKLRDDQLLQEQINILSVLKKNPKDLQNLRLLLVITTLMKEKGIETIEEFAKRF